MEKCRALLPLLRHVCKCQLAQQAISYFFLTEELECSIHYESLRVHIQGLLFDHAPLDSVLCHRHNLSSIRGLFLLLQQQLTSILAVLPSAYLSSF
eukprot:1149040-Pelagomonas_calceolata.AAC.2